METIIRHDIIKIFTRMYERKFIKNHKLKVKDYTKDELIIKLENEEVEVYLLNSLRSCSGIYLYIKYN